VLYTTAEKVKSVMGTFIGDCLL